MLTFLHLNWPLLGRRLGTCLLALGRNFEAEKLLQPAADRFIAKLGVENPVAGEARLACAIVKARQLLPFQVFFDLRPPERKVRSAESMMQLPANA